MATKQTKPQPAKKAYKLTGIASFPFLAKTAKDEARFPEDKYKVDVQVNETEFLASEFAKDVRALAAEWFGIEEDDVDIADHVSGIKFLNEDLEEDDKYYDYKKDMVRVRAKANSKSQPQCFDSDKTPLVGEDIEKISNGCKVNMIFTPYCFGDQDAFKKWEKLLAKAGQDAKKIAKVMDDKPIFGVTLGLSKVQFLEGTSGRAAIDAAGAELLDDVEVTETDIDVTDETEDEDVDLM